MVLKRLSSLKLKSLVKPRFWITRKKSLAYANAKAMSGRRKNKFQFGKVRRFFRILRFFRSNKLVLSSSNLTKRAKAVSLVRLLRTNKFSRKF